MFELTGEGWWPTQVSGHPELLDPTEGTSIDIAADGKLRLVVSTNALRPEQLDVLRAFADQLAMAVEARRLRVDAANADLLGEANALRAALLQAVSHDFRTPLATIKASASGLMHTDAAFSDADRRQLLADIDDAADRLDAWARRSDMAVSCRRAGSQPRSSRWKKLAAALAASTAQSRQSTCRNRATVWR